MSFTETIRSLRHRNFRLYFFGQWISMMGTWMQTTAQMWLVYRLTHSSWLLGLVGFAGQAPSLVLGLFGGVAADRWDRRRLIVITQSAALLQALALGLLTYFGAVQVWQVFALAFVLGIINVFDMPARQSFVIDMVDDRQDLGNAIAMNSFLVNASRMVGPAVAGILVGFYGEAVCFLLNALSFVAVIASLLMMRLPRRVSPGEESLSQAVRDIKAGLRYVSEHAEIRAPLLLLAVISVSGVPFMTLMPVFAGQVLRGGPRTVGWLMAASGIGALSGAVFLARRRSSAGLPRVAGLASAGFGLSLILFSSSRSEPLSLAFMVLTGACMMTAFTGCNTLLQSLTSDAMRGRVMGLFTMTFMGVAPIGNLLAGLSAQRVGAPETVGIGGLLCAVSSLMFLRRRREIGDPSAPTAGNSMPAAVIG